MGHSVALFNAAIWVAGGYGASGRIYSDVYSYDGFNWTQQTSLPQGLCNASLAAFDNKLYLFGGYTSVPGGAAITTLYCLSADGKTWEDQKKSLPLNGPADYWALGAVGGELRLLGSFGGAAFTGSLSSERYWQGGADNLNLVADHLQPDTPPYGFSTFGYGKRLFLVIATNEGHSVFAYGELASNKAEKSP